MAYDFHYQPTGSGAISGQQVLEQTEDAINELGDYVNDNVGGAMDVAQQALETAQNAKQDAQTALNTANNAEGVAIQAQNDVSNLSGTVTNIGNRVTTAEGNIGNLQGRMTTAEGNIGNLQGRMTTAEGNIGNLQTAVSTAQATANSAQQTATTARQQSYVFRYSSTALTPSSTNSNTLLDNTDNLKVGDKVIDSNGVLFSITAIDTANSTFTVGSALVDLALDANVVHTSGNETITGTKTLDNVDLPFKNSAELGVSGGSTNITFSDKNGQQVCALKSNVYSSGTPVFQINLTQKVDNTIYTANGIALYQQANSKVIQVRPLLANDNADGLSVWLGSSLNTFSRIYGLSYYYGNNNVEFSTKFVTTDTAQTISGEKTFSNDIIRGSTTITSKVIKGYGSTPAVGSNGVGYLQNQAILTYQDSTPAKDVSVTLEVQDSNYTDGKSRAFFPNSNNVTNLGKTGKRWANVYATNYYYGGSEIEFSQKFVTTDTNQIISGNKAFSSINGVEPSALSLPSGNVSDFIDISSYFTSGVTNTYTASANGWIYLRLGDISSCQATVYDANNNRMWGQSASGSVEQLTIPILKGQTLTTQWATTSSVTVATARFIPCQGNV